MTKATEALDKYPEHDWKPDYHKFYTKKHEQTIRKALKLLDKFEKGGVDIEEMEYEGFYPSYKEIHEKYILIERERI
jgi:hypothetical protein